MKPDSRADRSDVCRGAVWRSPHGRQRRTIACGSLAAQSTGAVIGRSRNPVRTSPGSRGSARRLIRRSHQQSHSICAPPDAKPKASVDASAERTREPDDVAASSMFSPGFFRSCSKHPRPSSRLQTSAMRRGCRSLHRASFHRGWGADEFEQILIERNALAHRLRLGRTIIGFIVSRIAADEAEILSVAIASESARARLFAGFTANTSRASGRARPEKGIPRSRGK